MPITMKNFMIVRFLNRFLDWIAAPGVTWILCLRGTLDWIDRNPANTPRSLLAGVLVLLIVASYAYQLGYKGYYRAGRKSYFHAVFIAPLVVGLVALLCGLINFAGVSSR